MPRKMPVLARTAIALAASAAMLPAHCAVITWNLAGNGFWDVAGNWTPAAPALGDDVFITIAGLRTVTFRSGAVSINSLTVSNNILDLTGGALAIAGAYSNTGTGTTRIGGGMLTLNGASTLGSLTQTQGSLAGTGTVTITGAANLSFGDHRGTGTTVLQGATTLSSSGFRLDGGRILRNESTLTWTAGQLLFNNTFNGASGGAGSGTFNNTAGANFFATGDGATSIAASNFGGTDTGADAVFNNAGTFRKSGSGVSNTTTVGVAFNNSGAVQVQTGVLSLNGGGSHTGSFDVAAGTVLEFGGGTHNLNAGSVTSAGTMRVGATVNVNTAYSIAGTTEVQSGVLNLAGGNATTGALVQSNGSVSGTGNLTVTGAAALTFGDHRGTGTTILQGASTISSSGFRLDGGRTLRNEGTLTWSGGQILFNSTFNGASGGPGSGVIANALGGTFIASGDFATSVAASNFGGTDTGADAVINNAGTFRKSTSGATNTTNVGVAFNNSGAVQVQTGILSLNNGGTHTGSFDVAAGAVLDFGGGTHNLNAGAITSPGTVRVSGAALNVNTAYGIAGTTEVQTGTLNLGGNATTGGLTQSNGSVTGSGNLTVTGLAALTFGDHRGTGTTTLQGASTISSSGFRIDGGRTLRNEGTLTWSGGQILFNSTFNGASGGPGSGVIANALGGTFIANGDFATSVAASNFGGTDTGADAVFNNAGTFRKSASGGSNTTNVGVAFNNSGAVQVQTGILSLNNGGTHTGSFDVAAGTVLDFGGGTHNLNGGAVTSPGTLRVSGTATVNVNAAYGIAGTTDVQGGSLNLLGVDATTGALTQGNGSVSGTGNLTVTGLAALAFGDHRGTGTTTLQGTSTISSSGFRLDGGRTLRNEGTLTWSGGQILFNSTFNGASGGAGSGAIANALGGTFIASGDFATSVAASNFGGTDTGADAVINNAGTFRKSASGGASTTTIGVAFTNSGLVQASTGTLSFAQGVSGQTGTLRIDPGAAVILSAPSSVGSLVHGGTGPSSLNLGANTVTVFTDYDNANFGSGNAFNRRANVAITGIGARLIAGGNANQGVAGVGVSNGNSTTPGLVIGNVHVGSTTYGYGIVNTGTSGPALRGAIQTAANGGSISDARLSGSGVTAGNWGPLATGSTLSRDVVLNVAAAGVFAPISGQTVAIVNNFDNTRTQVLTISSAAGAAAYNLAAAAPVVPNPVTLANQRLGGTAFAALTIANSAPAGSFTEGLNASFGATTGNVLTNGGSISLLGGSASNSSAMTVSVDATSAGAKSGTVLVNLASDGSGSGSSGLGLTALAPQTVTVNGNVYRLASAGAATPNPVAFGNVRIGSLASQALSITNTAANDGFSERLNASIGAPTAGVTASGSFTQLAAQATNNSSLVVGLDTLTAGARAGSATISLASDGTGTSGLAPLALAAQTVNVSGAVYRLANPTLNTPSVTLAARVGDAAPSASISLTNTSPDAFTERLNAAFGAISAGFSGSGAVTGLAAGASSNALTVSLNTTAAGNLAGTAALNLVSSGVGTTGAPDQALPGQSVTLNGRVYTPAVAQVNTTIVDFGIVHRGDAVAARQVSVTNAAAIAAPNDTLRGTFGGASAPFSASGTLTDLAAQATNATSFSVGLNTGQAGVFTGTAMASFTSHNAELADLALASAAITLRGQVNNFAAVALSKVEPGPGVFSAAGQTYTLDFGTIQLGSGDLATVLRLANGTIGAVGPADLLSGSFNLANLGSGFTLAGFGPFSGLIAGGSRDLGVTFLDDALGAFEATLVLHADGSNASGFNAALADTNIVLRGVVVAVPEPGTYVLMFAGLLVVLRTASARLRRR